MKKADKTYIKLAAKDLQQGQSLEVIICILDTIYLMGKTAESKERLDEFRKSQRVTGE